jgi:hypothetical protein
MEKRTKPMKLEEWRKTANKLNKKYGTYEELKKDCFKKFKSKEYFGLYEFMEKGIMTVLPGYVLEYVGDDRVHMCRDSVMYQSKETGFEKIETEKMIEEMVPLLSNNMDKETIKALMKDVLEDLDPPDLLEFYLRAVKLEGSIRPAPGCFKFRIGGKPGAPKELMIRS